MTLGAILTIVFACFHWIDGASSSWNSYPTIYVFIPMLVEFGLYAVMVIYLIVMEWVGR